MKKPVRWGIVSTGRITHTFARDLAFAPSASLQAVASRTIEPARAFAAQYGIADAHGSYAELLQNPKVDAVYIATPHTLHHDNARDAMLAGKAVLCEKPLTINPTEARSLMAIASQSDTYLMEAMWTWFLPAIAKAQEWVAEGRIGALRHLKADFGYPQLPFDAERREYNADLGGGCLLEMGIYPVAFNWLFMRQDPKAVQTWAHHAPNGVEDDVTWSLDYGDSVSSLGTSFRCRLRNAAYLIGDKGYIHIPDFFRASECTLYKLDDQLDHFHDGRSSFGFSYEIEAASRDILAGRRESRTVSLADSLKFQQHINELHERLRASRQG
jgi:predicted dehydrogenase